jgi:hypothetical protein
MHSSATMHASATMHTAPATPHAGPAAATASDLGNYTVIDGRRDARRRVDLDGVGFRGANAANRDAKKRGSGEARQTHSFLLVASGSTKLRIGSVS